MSAEHGRAVYVEIHYLIRERYRLDVGIYIVAVPYVHVHNTALSREWIDCRAFF
jgi:hypothetical protein